jgi:hypothetical protein
MDDDAPLVELAVVLFFLVVILGFDTRAKQKRWAPIVVGIAEAIAHKQ